jgi:hypothetical protein
MTCGCVIHHDHGDAPSCHADSPNGRVCSRPEAYYAEEETRRTGAA